jgi:hypothetical protein
MQKSEQASWHTPDLSWEQRQALKAQALREAERLRAQAIDTAFAVLRQALAGLLASARQAAPKRPGKEQQPCLR